MAESMDGAVTLTVVGLFDDEIDAEQALNALRKASRPSASISVLARDRSVIGESKSHPIDVTRAVMDTAMSSVSNWLTGLAALLVSDHGTFLAAGPIGVVLAKMRSDQPAEEPERAQDSDDTRRVGNVGLAFEKFGFTADESHYLEQRLSAGSVLIAVTAADEEQVVSSRRTFADFSAVFIGQARTSGEVVAEAERWIAHPQAEHASEVIVADVVVALRHACAESNATIAAYQRCGITVVDSSGESLGEADDLLVDSIDESIVRYVVVGHGGLLGIGRNRNAVPCDMIEFDEENIRARVERDRLGGAPDYDPAMPFSRKDELAVHQYFGTEPYWLKK